MERTREASRHPGPVVWWHRKRHVSNQHCPYCGRFVGASSSLASNREHWVGRNFTPREVNGDAFNFIFRACVDCNREKGDAERHTSTITLFNSPERRKDAAVNADALNRASKDFYPGKHGQLVRDAQTRTEVRARLVPGVTATFGLVAPPQALQDKTELLATYHVQGLFTLVTSRDQSDGMRILDPVLIQVLDSYHHGDWGNPQLLEIEARTRQWRCVANIETADGFFRALLRQSPGEVDGYFWALEWNRSLRIVGLIHREEHPAVLSDFPPLEVSELPDGSGIVRIETPLNPADDRLFDATVGSPEEA